ncbi:MAG: hypothetical protein IKB05_05015 [Alphaproteobacteria bacterium]|nr:hypothetical protein [Alphaproteobacteria bacterium]
MSEQRYISVQNKVRVDTNSDLFKFFVALATISIACNVVGIRHELRESNELRKQELEIAKKQYALDSLRYYAPVKQR